MHLIVGNKIVNHSDVVGALPVCATPTTKYIFIGDLTQWIGQKQLQDEMRNI